MFGQHWQRRQVQGQGAIFVAFEIKANLPRRFHLNVVHVGELGAELQAALGHQQLEGVAHILGGDGRAIGKAGTGVEVEAQPQAIVGAFHFLCHQAIDGVGLVL
ncbi:hypothetical protein D3C86_1550360 [compost metagenome]